MNGKQFVFLCVIVLIIWIILFIMDFVAAMIMLTIFGGLFILILAIYGCIIIYDYLGE